MKSVYLVLGIPVFIFAAVAVGLDLAPILALYPDSDLSVYLASVSIGKDFDLAYTRTDSDRFFTKHLRRPYPFQVVTKRILASDGEYKDYFAFYAPELYVFLLAPFTALFSFHGTLLLHTALIFCIYWVGYLNYRSVFRDPFLPSLNAVVFFSLVPIPVLYLVPSHHLFLFASILAAVYLGISGRGGWSGALLALAVSSQILSIVVAVLLIGFWQRRKEDAETAVRPFLFCLAVGCFLVWGIERLMYPVGAVSETRWLDQAHQEPLAGIWNSLPVRPENIFEFPSAQRVIDFFFGRNTGFLVYGFPACALLLTSFWFWKDELVRSILLFLFLFLLLISVSSPHNWNIVSFVNDFWIILCAVCFFLGALTQSGITFLCYIIPALVLAAPLLADPLGAIMNRGYYAQSLPYRLFPVELSLTEHLAVLRREPYQFDFMNGRIFLLNDNFYKEKDFFWVHGESSLEFLARLEGADPPQMRITNGSLENVIVIRAGSVSEEYPLQPGKEAGIDLSDSDFGWRKFGPYHFLHGKIESKIGYVPKLLSRDNPDYRFLGCQVRLTQSQPP